ncbi:flagellar basal body rod modification protein [compost metagenome]
MASVGTTPVWSNYSNMNKISPTTGSEELGKDAFLKLMLTQLQNQDPLSPMDNTAMVAQMAQFSSVEQLYNISTQLTNMSQSLGSNSNLIGKVASWTSSTETGNYNISTGKAETVYNLESGIVDSIIVRSGVHYAKIGDKEIEVSKIERVENPAQPETEASDVNSVEEQGADHS